MFEVFNNKIIFISIDLVYRHIPAMITYLANEGITHIDRYELAVLYTMNTDVIVKLDILDSLTYSGFALIYNNVIEILTSKQVSIKLQLLNEIVMFFKQNIYVQFPIFQARFDIDVLFYVKYGFANPELINDNFLKLKFIKKRSKEQILEQIFHLVKHKRNQYETTILLTNEIAHLLGQFVNKYDTEVGGVFDLNFNQEGIGVLGLSKVVQGSKSEFTVTVPVVAGQFSFHTHPDKAYSTFNTILGWPSGRDMASCMAWFLNNKNQIAHFVISSEGIWSICLTTEFQKILLRIKNNISVFKKCAEGIYNTILELFSSQEPKRSKDIDTTIRLDEKNNFLNLVKNYKIRNLFSEAPDVYENCRNANANYDVLLFNVMLIKWKYFKTNKDIVLSYSYILDEKGGFKGYEQMDAENVDLDKMDSDSMDE
jgi:hypothetical protein